MAIKEVYKEGFYYSSADDTNTAVPAILDAVQGESQMANPATDVIWDSGLGAAKFFMDFEAPTQTGSTIAGRTEHTSRYPPVMEAEEMWFSASYYFPVGEAVDPEDEILYQWHVGAVTGSPSFALRRKNGRFVVYLWIASGFENQMAFDVGPATNGARHDFVVYLFMHPTDGHLTVWKDGMLARCHNPITGAPWSIPTSPPGGGITNDYTAYPALGAIQQEDEGVSLLVWNGKTARGTYPNPTKYPKWGMYKPAWGTRYNPDKSIKPEAYDPLSPLYVAPEFRQKTIYIENVKFETRLSEFSDADIFQSIDINNQLPLEIPNWWDADYSGPWHVSNSGSDINNGSEAFPFATFEKALSVVQQGDTIKFECGGTYPPISISGLNGIASGRYYVTNYGTGANPVISGFVTPTWTNQGSNIWTYQDNGFSTVNILKLGSKLRHKGRLPKEGYNTITARSGNTQITDTVNISSLPDVVGGELVAKKNKWIMDTQTITAQTSTTLTTSTASGYQYTIGYGYFVQNHANCLTENGDWYYDSSTKTVHLYHTTDPNLLDIKIGKSENCLYQQSSSYWEFFGIDFEGSVKEAVILRSSHNVKFTRCSFNYHGFNGIQTWLSRYATVEYCHFNDIQNIAVNNRDTGAENPSSDMTIKNCYINGIAMIPGASGNGDGQACGIKIGETEHNVTIRNNRLRNLGYIGVYAAGNNCLIEGNYAENGCLVKSDGALFYIFGSFTGVVFRRNISINCYGNVGGTNHSDWFGVGDSAGFYADDNSDGVVFEGNFATNTQYGMYLHNCRNITASKNVLIGNHIQVRITDDGYNNPNLGDPVANLKVQDNTLIAGAGQFAFEIRATGGNLQYGTIDNNRIRTADSNSYRVRREAPLSNPGTTLENLSQWRDRGYDVDSTPSDYDQDNELILVNETDDTELFELDAVYEDIEGVEHSGSIQLDENESIYLYRTGDIPPPVDEYTVTLIAGAGGSVSGGGVYEDGEQATLTATPNTGWYFVRWSNDVMDNPYTFTVTGDVTLQAIFAQDEPSPGVIIVKGKFRIV